RVLREVVARVMREGYFSALPPKSCGREEFGAAFTSRLVGMCRDAGGADADVVATATALTAESVLDAYRRFVWAHLDAAAPMAKVEFCVAGGGAKNRTLMDMLREGFAELGVRVRMMDELGVPAQAKEGVAFALLAWLTWNGLAGNVSAATGAGRAGVLGDGCHGAARHPGNVVVIIESSPNNLDPRQGTDAQSEHVGALIFDALVRKDEHYNLAPWLATSWEQPDPLTWVFHLRDGVRFQNGQPLEAADVEWTVESLIDPRLATLISAKSGNFAAVDRVAARDRLTVVVHMKRPDAGLLFNLSDGLFGVVPRGAGIDFGLHPVGSG